MRKCVKKLLKIIKTAAEEAGENKKPRRIQCAGGETLCGSAEDHLVPVQVSEEPFLV